MRMSKIKFKTKDQESFVSLIRQPNGIDLMPLSMKFSMGSSKQVSPTYRASNPFCKNIRDSRRSTSDDVLLERETLDEGS